MNQRRVASRVALVLAFLLLPIGMVSVWISAVVANSDHYIRAVAPLASDPAVRTATIQRLDQGARQLIDPTGSSVLGQVVLAGTHTVVVGVVDGPFFPQAWASANRTAHGQLIQVLEGHGDQVPGPDGRISVGLGSVLDSIAAGLGQPATLSADSGPSLPTSFRLSRASDLGRAGFIYRVLHASGVWPLVLWLLAAIAVVVLEGDRRRAVRRLGLTGIAGMVALYAVLLYGRHEVSVTSPDAVIGRAIWDAVTRDLRAALVAVGVVSALVVALTFVPRRSAHPVAATPVRVA